MNFDIAADHRVKLKENEKSVKNSDLAGEQKKLWNMVTVITIENGTLGTIPKGLVKDGKCWKSEDEPVPSRLHYF